MTALSGTTPVAIASDSLSLNSSLGETGWRRSWVKDEQGQEKLVYFALTEADFLHPQEDDHLPSNTFHENARTELRGCV